MLVRGVPCAPYVNTLTPKGRKGRYGCGGLYSPMHLPIVPRVFRNRAPHHPQAQPRRRGRYLRFGVRVASGTSRPGWRGLHLTYSLSGCEANTRDAIARFVTRQGLRYHFHDKETGEHVGNSGLHNVHWDVPKFEIGYWCRTSKVGQGYVTEDRGRLDQAGVRIWGGAGRNSVRRQEREECTGRRAVAATGSRAL